MDFEKINRRIEHLQLLTESAKDPELKKMYQKQLEQYGQKKLKKCDEMLVAVLNQQAAGIITEDAAKDYQEEILGYKMDTLEETTTWFEETALAAGVHLAIDELKKLTSNVLMNAISDAIGKTISLPVKSFIAGRLKRYPLIYSECIEFKQLEPTKYDLEEMDEMGIHFKFATKWLEKASTRVHVDLYYYNDKPAIGLAYTQDLK